MVKKHGQNGLGQKHRKRWHCVMILVHLKEFGPISGGPRTIFCLQQVRNNKFTLAYGKTTPNKTKV
jgi:hypothetical protein